jgi:CRISPR-associated endonuclease/helicase Cas3
MFELLRRIAPDHAGMLGPHRELLDAIGEPIILPDERERVRDAALARELASLSAEDLDLVLYLVCSHHGKVRTSWSTTPNDQRSANGEIHGVSDGDIVEPVRLALHDGGREEVPALRLSLAPAALGLNGRYGASWGDRVARLLQRFGPFTLAYLEGVFRVADWKASQLDTPEDA